MVHLKFLSAKQGGLGKLYFCINMRSTVWAKMPKWCHHFSFYEATEFTLQNLEILFLVDFLCLERRVSYV